ncbi:MAG: CopG family transcriptional regulator [Geminicoccaceae bacterium]|nr:MAG: CopG family transcriptional regulator [Geminicoccaceae bacterium]
MAKRYPALIHKEPDSDYGVSFPDLPGCVAAAATAEAAVAEAREALQLHVDGMIEDGMTLPPPSPLDAVYAAAEGGIVTFIEVDDHDPAVRVNVTIKKRLLADADAYAARHGLTRSRLIAEALERRLARS